MTTYLEKREKDSFKKICTVTKELGIADPMVFDVGANIGQSVETFLKAFPYSDIFSFEPNPEAFTLLNERWGNQKNVSLYPYALHSKSGRFPFHATKVSEAGSLLSPEPELMRLSAQRKYDFKVIEVACSTLDLFCENNGISKIDILKLDVQGSELETLKGGVNLLKSGAVALLYIEVNFAETYVDQMQFKDLLGFCELYGYQLWDISPFLYTRTGRLWYSNTIFLNTESIRKMESRH